jgi:mycoredoxin
MTDKIILYGSPTCPMVPPVRDILDRADVDYQYVDIYLNLDARERVLTINNGNASVPTLSFPDGSTLTEPSGAVLTEKLEASGYVVRAPTLFDRLRFIFEYPLIFILGLLMLAFGINNRDLTQIIVGAVIVIVRILLLLKRKLR